MNYYVCRYISNRYDKNSEDFTEYQVQYVYIYI